MDRGAELQRVYQEEHAAAQRADAEVVLRALVPEALQSELFLVGQALGRDTQRLSGLPYVFPGGPPHRLSKGGVVLDRWLETVGYTIEPGPHDRRYAYHADLHPGYPGRIARSGDVLPSSAEIEDGARWLRREIELIEPRALIALGKQPALEILTRYDGVQARRLGEVTGRRFDITVGERPIVAFAAYHPSGAFQFPRASQQAWTYVAEQLQSLLAS